jgi:hypothetical protein
MLAASLLRVMVLWRRANDMHISRRNFHFFLGATALGGLGSSPLPAYAEEQETRGEQKGHSHYFFKDQAFETIFLTCLGRAFYSGANPGKVLYLTRQVKDGDFESAFAAFRQAGDEARAQAEESLAGGHRESARQAYLWAQNFYDSATYFVDGSADPSRFLLTWEALYDCWLKSLPLFDPPIEPIGIPYEGTILHGFYIRSRSEARRRPLLILNNGSDGSLLDIWLWGGAGARPGAMTASHLMDRDRAMHCGSRGYTSVQTGRRSLHLWWTLRCPVQMLIRNVLRFRASAREAIGFRARLPLRRGLLLLSPIQALWTFPPHELRRCQNHCKNC